MHFVKYCSETLAIALRRVPPPEEWIPCLA
jgi:hypothetical protein